MTGPEHYKAAEELLERETDSVVSSKIQAREHAACVAEAQVHVLLALVALEIDKDADLVDRYGWPSAVRG